MVESFTLGTPAMVDAMVERLPDKFSMELNREDAAALVWYLAISTGNTKWVDIPEEYDNWAQDLFSSIAESVQVEGI